MVINNGGKKYSDIKKNNAFPDCVSSLDSPGEAELELFLQRFSQVLLRHRLILRNVLVHGRFVLWVKDLIPQLRVGAAVHQALVHRDIVCSALRIFGVVSFAPCRRNV